MVKRETGRSLGASYRRDSINQGVAADNAAARRPLEPRVAQPRRDASTGPFPQSPAKPRDPIADYYANIRAANIQLLGDGDERVATEVQTMQWVDKLDHPNASLVRNERRGKGPIEVTDVMRKAYAKTVKLGTFREVERDGELVFQYKDHTQATDRDPMDPVFVDIDLETWETKPTDKNPKGVGVHPHAIAVMEEKRTQYKEGIVQERQPRRIGIEELDRNELMAESKKWLEDQGVVGVLEKFKGVYEGVEWKLDESILDEMFEKGSSHTILARVVLEGPKRESSGDIQEEIGVFHRYVGGRTMRVEAAIERYNSTGNFQLCVRVVDDSTLDRYDEQGNYLPKYSRVHNHEVARDVYEDPEKELDGVEASVRKFARQVGFVDAPRSVTDLIDTSTE